MGAGGVATRATAISAVRRLGYVAAVMHEAIMNSLVRGDDAFAADFNDEFKPIVDWLLNFDVSRATPEDEDGDEASEVPKAEVRR